MVLDIFFGPCSLRRIHSRHMHQAVLKDNPGAAILSMKSFLA